MPPSRMQAAIEPISTLSFGPQSRAGDRLGVEAAIFGIGVVARAILAHRERRHRGLRAIVGQRARQRVARPAMGAVDEGIGIEAARRVEQLGQARLADRGVGADARRRRAGGGGVESRSLRRRRAADRRRRSNRCARAAAARDASAWRNCSAPAPSTSISTPSASLQHEAAEREARGEAVGERSEAHALHGAAHAQAQAPSLLARRRSGAPTSPIPSPCRPRGARRRPRSRRRRRPGLRRSWPRRSASAAAD